MKCSCVVAVYNSSGTKVATYDYIDAWGNHSVSYTNGVGYSVGKFFTKVKADKILSMPRSLKKSYLADFVFKNSHDYVNANLNTFMDNPFGVVSASFNVFRYGVYSIISSTAFGAIFYQ